MKYTEPEPPNPLQSSGFPFRKVPRCLKYQKEAPFTCQVCHLCPSCCVCWGKTTVDKPNDELIGQALEEAIELWLKKHGRKNKA